MATEKIMLGINLRKNKNTQSTGFGKYYPEVDVQKTLSLRGFAEHMTEHNSYYPRAVVEGVLNQIIVCLPELLAQGVPVKLGSLGTFYPTAEVVENRGVPSIAAMEGLNPNDVVKAIHIRFLPDNSKLDNLCGPAFKDACTLELRNIVDTQVVVIGGKTRKVQTLKPIATAVAEWKAGNGASTNPSEGGENGGQQTGGDSTTGSEQGGTGSGGGTGNMTITRVQSADHQIGDSVESYSGGLTIQGTNMTGTWKAVNSSTNAETAATSVTATEVQFSGLAAGTYSITFNGSNVLNLTVINDD